MKENKTELQLLKERANEELDKRFLKFVKSDGKDRKQEYILATAFLTAYQNIGLIEPEQGSNYILSLEALKDKPIE